MKNVILKIAKRMANPKNFTVNVELSIAVQIRIAPLPIWIFHGYRLQSLGMASAIINVNARIRALKK